MVDFLCRLPLWLIPAFPTAGFLVLALFGSRLPRRWSTLVGVGSVGLAAATTLCTAISFLRHPPDGGIIEEKLWTWIHVGSFDIGFSLVLDGLSLVMIFVVTFVGFLIHLYSTVDDRQPDPDDLEFTLAVADNVALASLAAAIAPILGGWLHEMFGWRSVFWYRLQRKNL